jgi:5-methylcytosine-specific restriction endonuclease McrA
MHNASYSLLTENSYLFDEMVTFFLKHRDPMLRKEPRQRKTADKKPETKIVSRYINRSVDYELRKSANHQCEYVSQRGKRCEERAGVERDHVFAWMMGGSSKALENLRLLCRTHHRLMTEQTFGAASRPRRGRQPDWEKHALPA